MVSVVRVPTSCLETVGEKPVMASQPPTTSRNCPEDMACLDSAGMSVVSRWMRETLRWMEDVERACSEEGTP